MNSKIEKRVAKVARSSYGKLLSVLASQTSDIPGAEDALSEAFTQALKHWGISGIPDSPEAWLLTTARNKMRDRFKSAAYRMNTSLDAEEALEPAMTDIDPHAIPDERLKLLFVCAHPAIDERIRTPLMLQTVLGMDSKVIAQAFLSPAPAMAQRLVRAKKKIKNARIPFVIPEKSEMQGRLEAVLEAIYGAYSREWDQSSTTGNKDDLSLEALFLADLLVELLPTEPETLGLAALLNFSISRRQSNTTFVPLSQQNPKDWNTQRIARGKNLLVRAKQRNKLGRFQLEAAIQAVHCDRLDSGVTDWVSIVMLYEGVMAIAPTIGAAVARAVAIGEAHGPEVGLAQLKRFTADIQESYQPLWAAKAYFFAKAGDKKSAAFAFEKAIERTQSAPMRDYLLAQKLGL